LNFHGFVVTDFGAAYNGTSAAFAGTDFVAPGGPRSVWFGDYWEQAIANGSISEARLDDAVTRNLLGYFALGQDADDYPSPDFTRWVVGPAEPIKDVGREAITLLKNAEGPKGLPIIKDVKSIGVFGDAGPRTVGNWPWSSIVFDAPPPLASLLEGYQTDGGGSGGSPPPFVITPYEAIKPRAAAQQAYYEHYLTTWV